MYHPHIRSDEQKTHGARLQKGKARLLRIDEPTSGRTRRDAHAAKKSARNTAHGEKIGSHPAHRRPRRIWAKVEMTATKCGFLWKPIAPVQGHDIHGKWSLRASDTSGLSLEDVRVPDRTCCRERRPEVPSDGLKPGALRHRLGAIGAAMSCYDCALQYSCSASSSATSPSLAPAGPGKAHLDDQRNYKASFSCCKSAASRTRAR